MNTMDGNNKLIQQFLADGIRYMFGNPGTVEQGFLGVLDAYPDFQYISCLHESVAVAIADGYARKSEKPSVVQLHSGVGLGNAIGLIYQAMRGHSPLVIIAGEAGIKYDSMDSQMACNLVEMAKPVVKWAGRVMHKDSLLRMVRRAVKIAMTPPRGPVYLTLPADILDEENNEDVIPSAILHTNCVANFDQIAEATGLLVGAVNPIFIIGDGIGESHAQNELEALVDTVGAKVYGANHSQFNFNAANPLFQGKLGHMFGENSKPKIEDADVVFVAGTYLLPEVFPYLGNLFKKGTKVIHVDLNAYEIAKNHPVDLGILADPKNTIARIVEQLLSVQTPQQKRAAAERKESLANIPKPSLDANNIAGVFIECLSKKIGDNCIIFDEALTSSPYLEKHFPMRKVGSYFQTRGGSLGVGIPGAMGIKLASPESTVVAFTGDGGSMYTIQALNTAARYDIDVKVVILNNGSYELLKRNIDVYRQGHGIAKETYPDCFYLKPVIDFIALSRSMGILDGVRIEKKDDVAEGVDRMLLSKGTFVVDLVIS